MIPVSYIYYIIGWLALMQKGFSSILISTHLEVVLTVIFCLIISQELRAYKFAPVTKTVK